MFKFTIGSLYECLNGKVIKVLNRTKNKGYETLICSDGKHRYDRSSESHDAGRVTGTDHDYSCEDNILQENAIVPEDATVYRRGFNGNEYKNTYYKMIDGVWYSFADYLKLPKWIRANNQLEMNDTSKYKRQDNGGIFVIEDELELQERNSNLFKSQDEDSDESYQEFLKQHKLESQQKCRDAIFSESSKEIYESALALLTNEPQNFADLKSKVNAATGLDDAWAILSGLVEAGLAQKNEVSHRMSGVNIKTDVKYSYQLA